MNVDSFLGYLFDFEKQQRIKPTEYRLIKASLTFPFTNDFLEIIDTI